MFQCVGFQLLCPGAVFMKYFSNPNISLLQNPDLQKKLQSLQAHITSLSEQQVALCVPTYIFGNKILVVHEKSHANIGKEFWSPHAKRVVKN